MAVSVTGVMRAINKLSKPLQEKVLKKLGLSTEGLPGRTSKKDGITVGKARVKIEKKIDKLIGGGIGVGGTVAAYTAGDFINDLLGIKKMGDGTLRAEEKKKVGKSKSETTTPFKKKVVKKTPPKTPPSRPKSIKKKTEDKKKKTTQQYMKDKSGKATDVKFNSRGGMLKKGKK